MALSRSPPPLAPKERRPRLIAGSQHHAGQRRSLPPAISAPSAPRAWSATISRRDWHAFARALFSPIRVRISSAPPGSRQPHHSLKQHPCGIPGNNSRSSEPGDHEVEHPTVDNLGNAFGFAAESINSISGRDLSITTRSISLRQPHQFRHRHRAVASRKANAEESGN